jgi:hypothetical protein
MLAQRKAYDRLLDKDANLPREVVGDFHLPITLLFLHGLELTDAIEVEVLLAQSVVTPADLQLRALFEAVIQLEWLLKEDTARRAFAYQLFDVYDRLRFYRGEIPSTDEGKKRNKAFNDDIWTGAMKRPQMADPAGAMTNLERLLNKPGYKEAAEEYERMSNLKPKPRRPRHWYAKYDGPGNIEALAGKVGRPMHYEIVYRLWSSPVHGANAGQRVMKSGGIRAMRQASTLPTVALHASMLMLAAMNQFGNFYRPEEERARALWYRDEISPKLLRE